MCRILLYVLAIFCPPLAVLFAEGCTTNFWINLVLTFLLFIPGVIHAFYILCTRRHCHDEIIVIERHDHCRY
ncbi:unnamed protein product [Auanema sp. JU1783]|nr:unnamed protein product [Auanema sp. JU1783]